VCRFHAFKPGFCAVVAKLLLSVQAAEVSFGDKPLFHELAFNIQEGDKICLVGKNGAGKSTLMNVITGARELDAGTRWLLQGTTIGYLPQDIPVVPGQTVFDYVFEELKDENKNFENEYKIEQVVEPLRLNVNDRMDSLSGGQARRAALARSLVESPNILLLDEPTNHLDLEAIEWLETYLKRYRGALVCVSHDRAFLSNISDKVFWLDRGQLRVCPKGFAYFEEWSVQLLEQEEREVHNRKKAVELEVEWASRGVKARAKRNVRRVAMMKSERDRLRADKNALTRMLAKIAFTPQEQAESSSRLISEFYNVTKHFETARGPKPILENFFLRIQRGDRIGIVGKNGSGKTTFLKLLLGEMKQDTGTIKRAKDAQIAYFDQKRRDLDPTLSLQKNLIPTGSDYIDVMGKTRHVCGYLRDFLFDPRHVGDPASSLSGGQKNRLMLAKTLANPGNLMILDEPTNDLDMDTLDKLEDILSSYTGTLIVVSHDRDFLEQTVSKIIAFEGDGHIEVIIGGYHDYLAFRKARQGEELEEKEKENPKTAGKSQAATPREKKPRAQLSFKLRYELEHLPGQIEKLEAEMHAAEATLADGAFYGRDPEGFAKVSAALSAAHKKHDEAVSRWLELEELSADTQA